MSGSEHTRELLELFRKRSAELAPVDVLRQYEHDRFVRPAPLDPTRRGDVERLAFSLLPDDFERVELSPLAPLGTTAVLGGLSQDWAVATARGTEVLSDVTNVLALEAAARRRRSRDEVNLAASARVTRPQAPACAGQLAHFGLLGLVSAGRGERWKDWELRKATEHVRFYRELLQALGAEDVEVRVGGGLELDVAATNDPEERPYYAGGWFSIDVGGGNVADGGFVDWTWKLLSDRKERCLISGAGIERLAALTT